MSTLPERKVGTVYLLHFARPHPRGKHPQHYIGWIDGDANEVPRRVEEHKSGRGVPLVKSIHDMGIEVTIAKTWPGTRGLERKLKSLGSGKIICPSCNGYLPNARVRHSINLHETEDYKLSVKVLEKLEEDIPLPPDQRLGLLGRISRQLQFLGLPDDIRVWADLRDDYLRGQK